MVWQIGRLCSLFQEEELALSQEEPAGDAAEAAGTQLAAGPLPQLDAHLEPPAIAELEPEKEKEPAIAEGGDVADVGGLFDLGHQPPPSEAMTAPTADDL